MEMNDDKREKYDAVPGKGQAYQEKSGQWVYWTNVDEHEAKRIRAQGMKGINLADGVKTPCLDIQTFGGHVFAKWAAKGYMIPKGKSEYPKDLTEGGPRDFKDRSGSGDLPPL